MVDGRVGAGGRFVCVVAVIFEVGCLTRQHIDETTTTTTTSGQDSSGGESTAGSSTMIPEIMTTTETPGTTESPSCDDGEHNQGESDIDCGGPCSGCETGEACSDDADCVSQACVAGVCVAPSCFTDDDCVGLAGACTLASCGPDFKCVETPAHEGEACDDGAVCSTASVCQAGACTATTTVDCTAFDSLCTAGLCDPSSGACLAADVANGTACDDGDGCTANTACVDGSCMTAEPGALLFEDFSGPAAGWVVDKLWSIGAAASSPAGVGGADPALDHSPGDDNRLAGAGIGLLDQTTSHDPWCLTSPPVDTTMAGPSLFVSFWRHLHSPGQPAVVNTVEVWNGVAWNTLETGYDDVVDDAAWTFMAYNASGQQATDFRVRICFERVGVVGNYAGWSVDDVTVAPVPCTP